MIVSTCPRQSKAEVETLPRTRSVLIRFGVLFLTFASLLLAVTATKKKKPAGKHLPARTVALAMVLTKRISRGVARPAVPATTSKALPKSHWRVPNYADSTEGDQ